MFGYIRPLQPELKVKELEQYKACYCALCRALKENYGTPARFVLNYDFVFLAMLLWDAGEGCEYETGRCPLRPVKGKHMCKRSQTLDRCAGYSIILAYWKMRDTVSDEGFFKGLAARVSSAVIKRAYKKAAAQYPIFADTVKTKLQELSALEKLNELSMDKTADKFAQILCAATPESREASSRAKRQIFYHMGRWIYILDAANDISDDIKSGNYNPIVARYGLVDGEISAEIKNELRVTLKHSENLITSAYELLPENYWVGIIRNILYLGMPFMCDGVLEGTINIRKKNARVDRRRK